MQYFFISGASSTGKTTTIHAICGWLLSKGYTGGDLRPDGKVYTPSTGFPVIGVDDFSYILQKNGTKVLVHSATDDTYNVEMLNDLMKNQKPNVVISSCRDFPDWPREYLCQTLGLTNDYVLDLRNPNVREFPLAKITRRTNWTDAYNWYFENTFKMIKEILIDPPYRL